MLDGVPSVAPLQRLDLLPSGFPSEHAADPNVEFSERFDECCFEHDKVVVFVDIFRSPVKCDEILFLRVRMRSCVARVSTIDGFFAAESSDGSIRDRIESL